MAYGFEVDHRKGGRSQPRYRAERASNGRVVREEAAVAGDFTRLRDEIGRVIEGEVFFDAGGRALYATDASNYRQAPIGVIVPKSVDDIIETVALCRKYDAPIVMRGGGTSLAGQSCNVAALIDVSKHLNRVTRLDFARRRAEVEPGCILDTLRDAAERHHLTFGPDPATHDHNTLGGMLGNNSCGVHSIMSGRTSDNVESLDILTYCGERFRVGPTSEEALAVILAHGGRKADIYHALDAFRNKYADLIRERYPKIPRRVSGYENLEQLLPENGFNVARALVGTEGTCAIILSADLQLIHSPPARVLTVLGFEDVFKAADAAPDVLRYGPIAIEGVDALLVRFVRRKQQHPEALQLLPAGEGWLIVEFGADDKEAAKAKAQRLIDAYESKGGKANLISDEADQRKIWRLREAALGATAHVPDMPEAWPGWEDSAVAREELGDYLRDLTALFHKFDYEASVYGHFGDGLVHCRIPFDLRTEEGVSIWRRFLDEAADLVVRYGGSLSGEHGDGQARAELLEKMYGSELVRAFGEFKAIWDPTGRMNPGKIVDPFPITSNLRVGPEVQPPEVEHIFAYPMDHDSFTRSTRRCVGVGACRRVTSEEGVMCPSYMATHEEKYSTRGRARLLFEMLHGETIADLWSNRDVEEALDFCLACKACKSDCPVNVDMATYKAEFRAHHYARRLRPRAAYSMGQIETVARIASHAPRLVNMLLTAPLLASLLKSAAGVAPRRKMPAFAHQTFRRWRRAHPASEGTRGRIVLWADTFNNYFRPSTAIAATRALEALGYGVAVPEEPLCCGRPLYDWGFLDQAKAQWRRTLDALEPEIKAGAPVVGLEPACVSAFRDELVALFPGDERAAQLSSRMLSFSEFLDRHDGDFPGEPLGGRALLHLHCHEHAVLDHAAEKRVARRLGFDCDAIASGCCGMAGSFGFEREKYEVSMIAGERVLLPAIRAAPADSIVLANGFSCREQIEQGAGRATTHIAEACARRFAPSRSG